MKVKDIAIKINGQIVCCQENEDTEVEYAFSSDLMSDVLTIEKEKMVLITGLTNLQAIRTSEMSEISCIIFARAKKVNSEIISLAKENNMVLIESPFSMFRISGELYKAGLKPIF
jgi:serine kinase of HPr protein (carbohydrate metabolism regulator)